MKRGFTLVELLVVVAIVVALAVVSLQVFTAFRKRQALDEAAARAASLVADARSFTTLSRNASQYGAHLAATSTTLFAGDTYDPAAPPVALAPFAPFVEVSDISLAGGGADIVFERLTGATDTFGSFTLSLVGGNGAPGTFRTVVVEQAGIVRVEKH